MKTYKITFLLLIAIFFGSCRKDTPELYSPMDQKNGDAPSQIFESVWHAMNNGYAFWDIDPTDWDAVYDEYMPRFRQLDKQDAVETEDLQTLYDEIFENIVDHHLSLLVVNNYTNSDEAVVYVQPSVSRILARSNVHSPITDEQRQACIDKLSNRITQFKSGYSEDVEMGACSFCIDGDVIYLYFNAFSFSSIIYDQVDPVYVVLDNYLNMVHSMTNIKGIILDLRGNSGGYLADINYVLTPLLREPLTFFKMRSKNGLGRLDYGPWVQERLTPTDEAGVPAETKIVTLADMWSVSMSEMTSLAVKTLPNGCFVGETTYGATSPLNNDYTFSYGGAVSGIGFSLRMATSTGRGLDDTSYESIGIEPNIYVPYDDEGFDAGVDTQLNRALRYIREGR